MTTENIQPNNGAHVEPPIVYVHFSTCEITLFERDANGTTVEKVVVITPRREIRLIITPGCDPVESPISNQKEIDLGKHKAVFERTKTHADGSRSVSRLELPLPKRWWRGVLCLGALTVAGAAGLALYRPEAVEGIFRLLTAFSVLLR